MCRPFRRAVLSRPCRSLSLRLVDWQLPPDMSPLGEPDAVHKASRMQPERRMAQWAPAQHGGAGHESSSSGRRPFFESDVLSRTARPAPLPIASFESPTSARRRNRRCGIRVHVDSEALRAAGRCRGHISCLIESLAGGRCQHRRFLGNFVFACPSRTLHFDSQ